MSHQYMLGLCLFDCKFGKTGFRSFVNTRGEWVSPMI